MAVQVVVALAVLLAAVGFLLLTATFVRRREHTSAGPSGARIVRTKEGREPGPPPPTVAAPVPDSPEVQVNRRIFLNRVWLLAITVFGVAFGGTSLAFLWPNEISGFGGRILAGRREDILQTIRREGRYYNPEGRFYLVTYDTSDEDNVYVQEGVAVAGLMALYQKCAHLGCRVPFCETSHWFECPCHGSQYNFAGEVMPGSPAPHGLWRFRMEIEGDDVFVDTAESLAEPAFGVDTIRQPPAGPHCIEDAEGH